MATEAIFSASPRMRTKTHGFYATGAGLLAISAWLPLRDPHGSTIATVACIGLGLAVCAVLVAVGRGYAHTRVVITDAEVIIHNVGTKDVFPFDEVLGFDTITRTVSNLPGVPTAVLRLTPRTHGIPRRFPVTAFSWSPDPRARSARRPGQPPFQFDAQWAELNAIVDEMNAELDARRGGHPTAVRLGAAKQPSTPTPHPARHAA
ncbi:MAG: hypothetical protein AAGC46_09595 [Solirubrobacteraceae bacterium]|nr:hypothetical protein [Patulibacter sp.]